MMEISYYGILHGSFHLLKFSLLYRSYYFLLNKLFIKSESYNNLVEHKRMYILKNIIKSVNMFMIFLFTTKQLFTFFYLDQYDNLIIQYYGAAYVANDFLALLIVDKLPNTTIIHHRLSVLLYYILISFDINSNFVLKLLVAYTFFSYCAFMVNLYLGIRYFIQENNDDPNINNQNDSLMIRNANAIINNVRIGAYYNYVICCFFNWSIHSYLLCKRAYSNLFGFSELCYCLLLIPIIRDDLILMSWLRKKYNS